MMGRSAFAALFGPIPRIGRPEALEPPGGVDGAALIKLVETDMLLKALDCGDDSAAAEFELRTPDDSLVPERLIVDVATLVSANVLVPTSDSGGAV